MFITLEDSIRIADAAEAAMYARRMQDAERDDMAAEAARDYDRERADWEAA